MPRRSESVAAGAHSGTAGPSQNQDQDAAAGGGAADPAVVASRLAHLLTYLPGARDVLACGSGLSVQFTAELTARGIADAGNQDLENVLSGAAGDRAVLAALACVLSVPEQYFSDDAVAAQFDEDLDLLSGWLDYRNCGMYLCGTGTPDNRADLKALVHRYRQIRGHLTPDPPRGAGGPLNGVADLGC